MKIDVFNGNHNKYYVYNAVPGLYKIECWGAKGYSHAGSGGSGGYVSGYIKFQHLINLYVYPGNEGISGINGETFNGGGRTQSNGGGGSDVRLVEGNWSDFQSLMSRIIVAGGGGGSDADGRTNDLGGAGGGINGKASSKNSGKGASQIKGGEGDGSGSFGKGGGNTRFGDTGNGGGGGGYFGGGASINWQHNGGGGGSSFISGHPNCIAVDPSSEDPYNMKMLNSEIHYSGYRFFNTEMYDGTSSMPKPTEGFEVGHGSYGVVKISFFSPFGIKSCSHNFLKHFEIVFLIPLIKD